MTRNTIVIAVLAALAVTPTVVVGRGCRGPGQPRRRQIPALVILSKVTSMTASAEDKIVKISVKAVAPKPATASCSSPPGTAIRTTASSPSTHGGGRPRKAPMCETRRLDRGLLSRRADRQVRHDRGLFQVELRWVFAHPQLAGIVRRQTPAGRTAPLGARRLGSAAGLAKRRQTLIKPPLEPLRSEAERRAARRGRPNGRSPVSPLPRVVFLGLSSCP